jgi:hypothetical protein
LERRIERSLDAEGLWVSGDKMKRLTFLVLFLSSASLAHATCSHQDAPYELKQTDSAYTQAMKLKTDLKRQGIDVICVLPSKLANMFPGQLGAAFYRTSVGVIDVMFMPESVEFRVRVVETKKDGRYLYTFEGKPHANTPVWDSNRPSYFIQVHHIMFTTDDERVAQKLKTSSQPSWPAS